MFENLNVSTDTVNQLSLLGAALIVLITVFVVGKLVRQMKTDTSSGELADDNWDGIGEYKNPLPLGWAVSFFGTMVWAVWYWFAGYPLNAFSQIGQYNEEVSTYNSTFESKWANPDQETLMGMGEGVYLVQCAPCHGIAGDGIDGKAAGFDTWGTAAGVLDVINNGSKGLGYPMGEMPAGMASGEDAKVIAEYVANGMQGEQPASFAACASCHGADGKGLGGQSPDLTTYGKTAFVTEVLNRGKDGMIGVMPKFNDGRLTDIQKEAVGHYILSLREK
ncbi:MAG: c-type cytochrome [Epsilonproteobacteria bacterium]|nr:c-type cytochrome [Campylobacterota bacterium]